jgi:hypothetical protein
VFYGFVRESSLLESIQNLTTQVRPRNLRRSWQCTNHNVATDRLQLERLAANGTKPPGHQVARHRVAYRLRDDETESSRSVAPSSHVHQRVWSAGAPTAPNRRLVVSCADDAIRSGEHEAVLTRASYADSSVRPLRRRAARMERPARVRMRRRNPCTLARRRLFGWKVLLLIAVLR